ncbi:MAG: peptidase S13 [Desulfobulbaceae bacterium]|nr:MAG: peptidase S13 [Desulfobulbaceae bacterium]
MINFQRLLRLTIHVSLGAFVFFTTPSPALTSETCPVSRITELLENGGYIVTHNGQIIEQCNSDQHYIPASTIKTVSALIAFTILQPTYRFQTDFFYQNKVLTIKGFGDPFLTSEEVLVIGRNLRARGITEISELVLDQSTYQVVEPPDGTENSRNPYDTKNGALAVNFNSIPVIVSDNGVIESAEPQTPLLPIMREIGLQLDPGINRVNVFAYPSTKPVDNGLRYVAELFIALLDQVGIKVSPQYRQGHVQSGATPIYSHFNALNLEEVVTACLKYSNNFIANQILLQTGLELFSPPASWPKVHQTIATVLTNQFSINLGKNEIYEGSGISRRTRVSPRFLIEILEHFKPFAYTMNKRGDIHIKSGTMKEVYSYVGYFTDGVSYDPFVILLNQETNNRDTILSLLAERYKAHLERLNHNLRSRQP